MTTTTQRVVRRPYYRSVNGYWDSIESFRTKQGLPDWCFDFVSIHHWNGKYSIMSPTCLIGPDSKRPSFEQRELSSFEEAKAFAMNIANRRSANGRKIHVVNCCKQGAS